VPSSEIDTHIAAAKNAAGQDYRGTFVNLCLPAGGRGAGTVGTRGRTGGGARSGGTGRSGRCTGRAPRSGGAWCSGRRTSDA
jgi:hypothetical protein